MTFTFVVAGTSISALCSVLAVRNKEEKTKLSLNSVYCHHMSNVDPWMERANSRLNQELGGAAMNRENGSHLVLKKTMHVYP